MKALIACLAVVCLVFGGFVYVETHPHEIATLMPGQRLSLETSRPMTLTLSADYPVAVVGNGCRALRTASVTLACGAGEIIILDERPPLLVWGHSNRVEWRGVRY